MRCFLTTLGLGVCLVPVLAATATGDGRPAPKPAEAALPALEAEHYAVQMIAVAETIAREFVRPVTQEKLVAAGLQGLYEAAHLPIPDYLQGDLDKALADRDLRDELMLARQTAGNKESLKGDRAVRLSVETMMRVLDSHSAYNSQSEMDRFKRLEGYQVGVGLTLDERTGPGPLTIRTVALGVGGLTPAQRAGLRPGDLVLSIDGVDCERLTTAQAMEQLSGDPDLGVTLAVRHPQETAERSVELVRKTFQEAHVFGSNRRGTEGWDYWLDEERKIGYVRVTAIGRNVPGELLEIMDALQAAGLRGFILDLRDCASGFIEDTIKVADFFLDEGTIATIRSRATAANMRSGRSPIQPHVAHAGGYLHFPMIVLIGPETSGAGEMIAAALQDHKRALVAGQRSRGKASVQQSIDVYGTNHSLKLTTGLFVRPSGKALHRFPDGKPWDDWGVHPNPGLEIRLSPPLRRQVRTWRFLQDTRAEQSREVLPLDNLEADPVLSEALAHLRQSPPPRFKLAVPFFLALVSEQLPSRPSRISLSLP